MSSGLEDFSLFDLFRMEAEEQVRVLQQGLIELEAGAATALTLESLMRAAHSIKGAARIVGLEAIVNLKPDFILVSEDSGFAEDEGSAFLLHPALERFYPASKRIVIPERLTVCSGPMLPEALERLASELERVDR